MNIDKQIRAYIMTLPGTIWGASSLEVLTKVKVNAGVTGTMEEVRAALWRSGYVVGPVGGRYCVGLPEGPFTGPLKS